MDSVGTVQSILMLKETERILNTMFSRAELQISVFLKR